MGIRCADHVTPLYLQKLALTSPIGGGRSVGVVRSRTKATEFFFYYLLKRVPDMSPFFVTTEFLHNPCLGVLISPQPDPTEKKQLKGRHFSSDAEVIAVPGTWLEGQPSEFFFFLSGLQKLEFGRCSLFPSCSG